MPSEWRATYRLQLQKAFTFADAAGVAGYLAELGISHLYLSPIRQAVEGSTHGYDAIDFTRLSRDLGGEEGFAKLLEACRRCGLGLFVDVVPNHMAASAGNRWWWDVLENGPSSRYAEYFDIDWEAADGRLILPVLGDHYGAVLERGEIRVVLKDGAFNITYHEHRFPLAPRSLDSLLAEAADQALSAELAWLADSFAALPVPSGLSPAQRTRRHRDKEMLGRTLLSLMERPAVAEAVAHTVTAINADPARLDRLLERQNYRLVHWRTAQEEIGYRRFFDINTLVALRMERADVFDDCHRLIFDLIRRGDVDGLRIDHPDGLREPSGYFNRLSEAAPEVPIYIEKILEPDEPLPPEWPVAGTTGYDFLRRVDGLFVDPAGEKALEEIYTHFTGESAGYGDVRREKKRQVLKTVLASDLHRVGELFLQVCRAHWQHRDYLWADLRRVLLEVLVDFPVYREYPERGAEPGLRTEGAYAAEAIASVRARVPELPTRPLYFLAKLLTTPQKDPLEREFVQRFHQLAAPAMAKGAEDTAFYAYNRLVALNEVGGDPGRFGLSLADWHRSCIEAAEAWPRSLLATATHDSKRGEDMRARLLLLAQLSEQWEQTVLRLAEAGASFRSGTDESPIPDRNTEYLVYQTLVGTWPIDAERAGAYMLKAVREAKVHTSWLKPDETFEAGLRNYINGVLANEAFRDALADFMQLLAHPARAVGLARTLLKLTAPGIPDFYQGTELWQHDLVDPDNRRPVDYEIRRQLLAEEADLEANAVLARMEEGLPKLRVIRRTLAERRRLPGAFAPGAPYRPVRAEGVGADGVVGFFRGEDVVVLVPRFPIRYRLSELEAACELPAGRWREVFTGHVLPGGRVELKDLWRRFPVTLLVRA